MRTKKHIAPQYEVKFDAPEPFALVPETVERPEVHAGQDQDEQPEPKQTDFFPDY